MLACALLTLIAAQPSPTVGLSVQPPVGLSPDEAATLVGRVQSQLQGIGLSVVESAAVEPECVTDPACVDQVRAGAAEPHDAMLVIELVRIGPVVQVTATGAAGDNRVTGSASLDEAQVKEGSVLPEDVVAWAKGLAPAPAVVVPKNPDPIVAPTPFELTPLKSGALFAGGVGIIALGAGVILVATSEPVLQDATSLGAEKEQARTLGLVGLGASVLGVAGVGAAVGLWMLE